MYMDILFVYLFIVVVAILCICVISLNCEYISLKSRPDAIKTTVKKLKEYYLHTPQDRKNSWHFTSSICYFENGWKRYFFCVSFKEYILYLLFANKVKKNRVSIMSNKKKEEFEWFLYGE